MNFVNWETDWERPLDFKEFRLPEKVIKTEYMMARKVDSLFPAPQFFVRRHGELSDALVNTWGWRIFSPRLCEIINRHSQDPIQYLAAKLIKGSTPIAAPKYQICNPLLSLPAIDHQKSELRYFEKRQSICGIQSLVLDQDVIRHHSFFRLQGWSPAIIVRKDLADAILQAGLTGMRFLPLDKVRA